MRRRELLKYAGATALAAPFIQAARADTGAVKIGVVGAKTGPLAPGAAATFFPPWQLWAHEVNQAGGLKLKNGARKVELIEYDDHTQPPRRSKRSSGSPALIRLIGSSACTAPASTSPQRQHLRSLAIRKSQWPASRIWARSWSRNIRDFFSLMAQPLNTARPSSTSSRSCVIGGQMGNKVAMVNVADEYGIESANISRKLFPAAGFELVYDKSYPLGTQDYSPVIKAAKAANPDAFIAYSYPPDTFGLTDQAKIENFNVKAYYNGIGCAFAGFSGKYGAAAENVIGFGGMPDNEKIRAFLKLHKEVTGIDSDYNACPYFYANGQVLTQAFEGAGTVDREAVTAYLKSHTFKTLIGEIDLRSSVAEHRLYRRAMAERLLPFGGRRRRACVGACPRAGEDRLGVTDRRRHSGNRIVK